MALSGRDHAFHRLGVARVVSETADAATFVLDVPSALGPAFAYSAGQFLTFRVIVEGQPHLRSYSMSSAPGVDDELAVTVKRVAGGVVSNWMIDHLGPGDVVEATCPAGVFCLGGEEREVVAFAAGSGITPVFSLAKTALAAGGGRRVRLLYANRDRGTVIFENQIAVLRGDHPDRMCVVHHLDVEHGFVDAAAVTAFVGDTDTEADCYVCGPAPFMDIVEGTLLGRGVPADRIHIERFTPAAPPAAPAGAVSGVAGRVTVELNGKERTADHHPGTTILQTARQMGLAPPYSCESGNCATCMARLVEGEVTMRANNALTPEEVEDGWVLTCQSVPTTPSVRVIYEEA
jgi:ferredoxin-NADP reductase